MPQRLMPLLSATLGVLGLLVVGVLIVLRADPHRWALTGPRWRRRLVAAGLALLAVGADANGQPADLRPSCYAPIVATQPAGLAARPEWQQIRDAWEAAREIVSDAKGHYPFDAAGKKTLLDRLEKAKKNASALAASGAISDAEAALLKTDLTALAEGVQGYRPTEMRDATCYKPISLGSVAGRRIKALEARAALLDKLAAQKKLTIEVVTRALGSVEHEASLLTEAALKDLPARESARGAKVREEALAKARALRAKLGGEAPAPEASPHWATITGALEFAGGLATTGKSTQAQRIDAQARLAALKTAANSLASAGLLAAEEARLLTQEADRIEQQIQSTPPTDFAGTCYRMAYTPPARKSLDRLTQRLPLLSSLAASGKVHPAAIAKIVPAIEADLAVLADPAQVQALPEPSRATAATLARQARDELARLKALTATK